jgi:hypothetical protein
VRTRDAVAVAVMLALIAGTTVHFLDMPAIKYYPLQREWSMETLPGQPGMKWYGASLWQLGAAAATGTVAWVALRRRARRNDRPLHRGWVLALTLITFLSLVAFVTNTAVREVHRLAPPPAFPGQVEHR